MASAELTPGLAISALDFNVGDWVTRYDSAFPGRVVGVHPGIDLITVEYPTGIEQEDPEYLIVLPVFHDSLGATRHNVLLLSRINQNLRTKAIKKANMSDFFVKISREDHLSALGYALLKSAGKRKIKIAAYIKDNFTKQEWVSFLIRNNRVNKLASFYEGSKKKNLSKTAEEASLTPAPQKQAPSSDAPFVEHLIQEDLPPEYKYTRLKPFARRSYLMSDGRKLKIIVNPFKKKFQLILNKKVLDESTHFPKMDIKFKKIVRKDKRFSD